MAPRPAATQSLSPNPIVRGLRQTKIILEMIKFEHTIFMLPFALMAAVIAGRGHWPLFFAKLPWILLAMVGARSAAMAFNRIVDRKFDAANPRTAMRALPAGQLTVPQVTFFTIVASALLVFASAMLNPLALALSPVALLVVFFYSYTKRFTPFSHLALGIALAIAPVGAWIAILGRIDAPALWIGGAVVCWLFGFDIIYALQDTEFDKANGLYSVPAWLGNARALLLSRISHVIMIGLLAMAGVSAHLGVLYAFAVVLVAALVWYEQSLVKPNDLSKLNLAFFTLNGYISMALFVLTLADVVVGSRLR
ncbi:4-hydroxybenzoate octaprenyltransferase [Capsulimonas corticalis]|uniref:4-hydroxybenzoate polyprenyltransferase n=1 Tax=Capsulimonas corticalis TaxID=2219043 RepID=A0A402CXZ1_9BACT|nr:UbiA-like polyprenyltransferase [Capsulimonas corticalis]BDI32155.1 4-hydroxybenzoate octaprenyltransferase [Capsulimonas corticalis]